MSAPSEQAGPTEIAGSGRQSSGGWQILVGTLFVIAVAAIFSYVMSENPEQRGETVVAAFSPVFIDTFQRPASNSLGDGPGVTWKGDRGAWAIEIGVVHVAEPDPFFNAVVADTGSSDVSIAALVGGAGLCGLTVRYRDPDNYLALLRVSGFGVWNIVEVVDGNERVVGTVADVPAPNVTVTLEVGPSIVTAVAGLYRTSIVVDPAEGGTKVGFMARGGAMETCTWDDAVVQEAT